MHSHDEPKYIPLNESFANFPKRAIEDKEREDLEKMQNDLERQAARSKTEMRRFDLENQSHIISMYLEKLDHIGRVPTTPDGKKAISREMIEAIGGWPDKMTSEGMILTDWNRRYQWYLGIAEVESRLGWREGDFVRTPTDVFNHLGGVTQRAVFAPSITHPTPPPSTP